MRVHRTDLATAATAVEQTPQGGVRVRARVARTGVLRYRDEVGGREWGEYRPPEEVFAPDSLATLAGATVTDLHPAKLVDPQTFRDLTRGHAHDDVGVEDGRFVAVSLAVQDADLCRMVLDGERRDVSAGYTCEVDPTPGTTPEGEPYDGVQRRIRFNHVALGPRGWGRSGTDVGLRMDGAAHEVSAVGTAAVTERDSMEIKLRGRKYRTDAADDMAAMQKDADELDKSCEGMKADIAKKDAENGELMAKLEAAQAALTDAVGEVAKAKAELTAKDAEQPAPVTEEMVPEEVMDAALARRESLRADAAVILGDEGAKGMKPSELKRAALGKLAVKTDGMDAKMVDTLFTGAVAAARAVRTAPDATHRNDALGAVNKIGNPPPSTRTDDASPEAMQQRESQRWQQPHSIAIGKGA